MGGMSPSAELLLHPDNESERRREATRLTSPVRDGHPGVGWIGDPDLVVCRHRLGYWEVLRHTPRPDQPQRYQVVAKSPVGAPLNEETILVLCIGLRNTDTHRKGNSAVEQMDRMLDHNDKLEKENLRQAADATADTLAKFYHEAGRTLGVPRTQWGTGNGVDFSGS